MAVIPGNGALLPFSWPEFSMEDKASTLWDCICRGGATLLVLGRGLVKWGVVNQILLPQQPCSMWLGCQHTFP